MPSNLLPHLLTARELSEALVGRLDDIIDLARAEENATGPWLLWPSTYRPRVLISKFGVDRRDAAGKLLYVHEGIDLRAPNGTQIVAAADGVVDLLYKGYYYGNCVRIHHDRSEADYRTYYAHLQKWLVVKGQTVKAGDMIGLADNTGNSTGAHLHLTLVKIGDRTKLPGISLLGCIDPLPLLIEQPEKIL